MNFFKIMFFLGCVASTALNAQETDTSALKLNNTLPNNDSSGVREEKQASDIIFKILKIKRKKAAFENENIKVGKLLFAILPGVGYNLQSAFTGIITANVSFYLGEKKTTNISVFNTDVEYSPSHHQTLVPFVFNVWLKDNKFNFVGDIRYLIFPSSTYGLGAYSYYNKFDKINYTYLKAYVVAFKPLRKDFYFGLGYNLDYHWKISSQDTTTNTNFQEYNQNANQTISSGIYVSLKYDSRRNINNPQGGAYCNVSFRPNLNALGSDNDYQTILIDARKYFKFNTVRSNILGFWSYNWLTFGKTPYLDMPSNGWDTYANVGRGYVQGRFRGPKLIYLESEYRFGITRNGLFGMVLFANAQSYAELLSNKFEKIIPAAGTGVRVKINKRSNVNFAVDYAVGINGSNGFFFNISEVF